MRLGPRGAAELQTHPSLNVMVIVPSGWMWRGLTLKQLTIAHVTALQTEGVEVCGFKQAGGGLSGLELVLELVRFRAGAHAPAAPVGSVFSHAPRLLPRALCPGVKGERGQYRV